MKNRIPLVYGLALLALAYAGTAIVSCAGPSPWLKPQGELVQLERQAAAALELAKDPRARAALQLCITSAQAGAHRIDELLQAQEQLRQAKKQGVDLPELQEKVKAALRAATLAEDVARTDCSGAGVRAAHVQPAPDMAADAGAMFRDGGVPMNTGAAAPDMNAHDMQPRPAADGGSR